MVWIVISTLTLHWASPRPCTVLRLEINVVFTEIFGRRPSICSHHMWTYAMNVMDIGTSSDMLLTYTTFVSTHMRTCYFINVTDSATIYHVFLFHDARLPCVLLHVTHGWFMFRKFSRIRSNRATSDTFLRLAFRRQPIYSWPHNAWRYAGLKR